MRNQKLIKMTMGITLLLTAALLFTPPAFSEGQFTVLHSFAGGATDGSYPQGDLILNSGTLYGMTSSGGSPSAGTLFSYIPSTNDFDILHNFGASGDGSNPWGSLILDSGKLYGMTSGGGSSNKGTIFSYNTSGNTYTVLHRFAGGADGNQPWGSLIINSGTLYGMTYLGGSSNVGTIFSSSTSTDSVTVLHTFTVSTSDGSKPEGNLMFSSGTLYYGMTSRGGALGGGTLFSFNTSGNTFTVLHNFADAPDNGLTPPGTLILFNGKLYGMTTQGGSLASLGTIFSLDPSNNAFTILHSFAGGADGKYPYGSIILGADGKLYGMTAEGGSSNLGTIFSLDPSNNAYNVLHSFAGGALDGSWPYGSLIFNSGTLYGMTYGGGSSNNGTIFSLDGQTEVPEPATILMGILGFLPVAFRWMRRFVKV